MELVRLLLLLGFVALCQGDCQNSSDSSDRCGIENIFAKIGFSSSCVSQTLATCEKQLSTETLLKDLKKQLSWIDASAQQVVNLLKPLPRNCLDHFKLGDKVSGVRKIYPYNCRHRPVEVFCDQVTDGGGWTVIQHRDVLPIREVFYRDWITYRLGFGNKTGEYWLGLENIRALVSSTLTELRVDLMSFENETRFAKYDYILVEDAANKYTLRLGNYSGDAGDSLRNSHGQNFTTFDQDNDRHLKDNCAEKFRGGWWYNNCHFANLNGLPLKGRTQSLADGIIWQTFKGYKYSLKRATMSVRDRYFNLKAW